MCSVGSCAGPGGLRGVSYIHQQWDTCAATLLGHNYNSGTRLQQWDTITIMGRQNKSTGAPTLLDKNQGIHFGSVVCFDLIRGCDRYTGANCNQIYSDLHKSEIAQQFMIKTHCWNINMIRGN